MGRDTRGEPENDAVNRNSVTNSSISSSSRSNVFLSSDPNPSQPSQQALFVQGTDGADKIEIRRGSTAGTIRVTINGVTQGQFNSSQVSRIFVYGGAGDDNITIFDDIGAISTSIYGEAGNDAIVSGLGANLIDGGNGNDTLVGNTGIDILIGGRGRDSLNGNRGSDILIGGSYRYAEDPFVIDSLLAAWSQVLAYSQRVANLKNNNWFALNNFTVIDDGDTDSLTGGQDQD
ncbi:MAG: calcium-binding protein [Microcystaceae cyanobacterium]